MDLYVRYKLLKVYHTLSVIITVATPLIIVPFIAYKFGNWWLLFGLLAVLLGQFLGVLKKGGYSVIALATLFCIGLWMRNGFSLHQYVTFFYFCLLFGFISFGTMNEYQKRKEAVGEQVYESVKHELTHGETGKKLQKEINEEMEKLFGKKNSE